MKMNRKRSAVLVLASLHAAKAFTSPSPTSRVGRHGFSSFRYTQSAPLQSNRLTIPYHEKSHICKFKPLQSSSSSTTFTAKESKLDQILSKLTSLFPLFVLGSAVLGSYVPTSLNWVNEGSLISMMLAGWASHQVLLHMLCFVFLIDHSLNLIITSQINNTQQKSNARNRNDTRKIWFYKHPPMLYATILNSSGSTVSIHAHAAFCVDYRQDVVVAVWWGAGKALIFGVGEWWCGRVEVLKAF
jgi:hypothetical protein